jgi:hypothetical protein
MVCVTNALASTQPRREDTRTLAPEVMPNFSASNGLISTYAAAGLNSQSTANFSVRVPVCHWAELPRPVSNRRGNSTVGSSRNGRGVSNTNRALPSGWKKRPSASCRALFRRAPVRALRKWPLNSSAGVKGGVIFNAGDVTWLVARKLLQDLKDASGEFQH